MRFKYLVIPECMIPQDKSEWTLFYIFWGFVVAGITMAFISYS